MDIREWFGRSLQYSPETDIDTSFDSLLSIYQQALTKYFGLPVLKSIMDVLIQARIKDKGNELDQGQKLFLDWYIEKGYHIMKQLVEIKLPKQVSLIAEFEYEIYTIQNEIENFEYPDDVRSCLINLLVNLPETIKSAEMEAEARHDTYTVSRYLHESSYQKKESPYFISNLEESAKTGSFIFF
jgi:hypothetical protein